MKKNVLFLVSVAFAFLAGGTAFPQLYHIDFDSFPSDAVYRGQVQDFADAADPFDAVREYERMVNDIFKGSVPTDVLAYFCSITYMAMMFTACQLYTDAVVRD
jgi:hypothetical protein